MRRAFCGETLREPTVFFLRDNAVFDLLDFFAVVLCACDDVVVVLVSAAEACGLAADVAMMDAEKMSAKTSLCCMAVYYSLTRKIRSQQ